MISDNYHGQLSRSLAVVTQIRLDYGTIRHGAQQAGLFIAMTIRLTIHTNHSYNSSSILFFFITSPLRRTKKINMYTSAYIFSEGRKKQEKFQIMVRIKSLLSEVISISSRFP